MLHFIFTELSKIVGTYFSSFVQINELFAILCGGGILNCLQYRLFFFFCYAYNKTQQAEKRKILSRAKPDFRSGPVLRGFLY